MNQGNFAKESTTSFSNIQRTLQNATSEIMSKQDIPQSRKSVAIKIVKAVYAYEKGMIKLSNFAETFPPMSKDLNISKTCQRESRSQKLHARSHILIKKSL
jgi:hypothetical protein